MRALPHLVLALYIAAAEAAPTEWLDGTVLADCEYCRTDAFRAERRIVANQLGPKRPPTSGMGYVVTLHEEGRFVWGRAALLGTGNLIRTDAHVLFADTGQLKHTDANVYFEPLHHGHATSLIEIDLSSVQRGGAVGPLETNVKNDWAIARLHEDAIEKFRGDRVFAFFWDFRVTQDDIGTPDHVPALVLSREHTFDIHRSCQQVLDDHPSRYAFGVEEVLFVRCPAEHLQAGSSGSVLALLSPDETWSLGGQIVGRGIGERTQLLLGNVPELRQTLTILYLQELIRRGLDPRKR